MIDPSRLEDSKRLLEWLLAAPHVLDGPEQELYTDRLIMALRDLDTHAPDWLQATLLDPRFALEARRLAVGLMTTPGRASMLLRVG